MSPIIAPIIFSPPVSSEYNFGVNLSTLNTEPHFGLLKGKSDYECCLAHRDFRLRHVKLTLTAVVVEEPGLTTQDVRPYHLDSLLSHRYHLPSFSQC